MLVGDVLVLSLALLMLVQPVRAIGTLNAVTQEGLSAGKRVLELISTKPNIRSSENAVILKTNKAEIEFSNVSFSFKDKPILKDISFKINEGETVALVGESGAGKSTLINLIPRFFDINKVEFSLIIRISESST